MAASPARLRRSRKALAMPLRQRLGLAALVALALAVTVFSIGVGASSASLPRFLYDWLSSAPQDGVEALRDRIMILDIRLPRAILGLMAGAGLAVSGAIMQGLFRNPLADPGVVGVSAGASLGAVGSIVLGASALAPLASLLGPFLIPIAAFVGGLTVTMLLYAIASRDGETQVATLLIAGIAIGALAMAGTGLLVYMAEDQQLRDISFWSLGSLAGASWDKALITLGVVGPSLIMLPFLARGLNAFTLGEAAAMHMGVPVETLKKACIFLVAAMTGVAVAFCGVIGFVGIIVPHILRLAIGPDHRFLLPASALLGGTLLIGADIAARIVVAPAELPIGILTALMGAPFFLWILFRGRASRIL
ncbi:iron ABC transporter permease [Rhizobium sp. G21]|uniref:FecCD family ABC transporter permease n=1 Tax=Rhizobium sp. G21 TaxID=2758439 RepID=UPI00160462A4|nr:iron ABC transporter permease [Rhizobium sp. G21]